MDISVLGDKIDLYENGDMTIPDAVDFFCTLANHKLLNALQGSYMRQFEEFRTANLITYNHEEHEWTVSPEADEIW